jgi:hypothetical protein
MRGIDDLTFKRDSPKRPLATTEAIGLEPTEQGSGQHHSGLDDVRRLDDEGATLPPVSTAYVLTAAAL